MSGGGPVRLLFVDAAIAVADKPAGLPSVPGRAPGLEDSLLRRVQAVVPDALLVHRLDMATSGLLLFARGLAAQRSLGRAFEARRVDKRYVAIVDGLPEDEHGQIALPIGADWPHRPRQKVDHLSGREALTEWQVLEREPLRHRTRLALRPVTGRSHQLRLHLAAIGHAVLGDTLYAPPAVAAAAPRLLLHAQQLAFAHPLGGAAFAITSPPPF